MSVRHAREKDIHMAIVEWVNLHRHLTAFHVRNEGKRVTGERLELRAMGMLPGVADLVVMWPGGGVGFLEVKTSSGRQTKAQRMFQARCQVLGHRYAVVRSVRDTEAVLAGWYALRGLRRQGGAP